MAQREGVKRLPTGIRISEEGCAKQEGRGPRRADRAGEAAGGSLRLTFARVGVCRHRRSAAAAAESYSRIHT